MNFDISTLPDDMKSLKNIILNQQADSNYSQKQLHEYRNQIEKYREETKYQKKEYENKISLKDQEIEYFKEQTNLLKSILYARKSEKLTEKEINQILLFNELEETIERKRPETITVPAHKRRKRGRKALPANLPRIEIVHDLSEEEKIHSCGREMKPIGQEITERFRIIPQQIVVERHIRKKYACECEGVDTEGKEGAIRIASMPKQLIPKSMATPSLLAYILIGKFADALPFYRQEKIFQRIGIDLPRQTMCRWSATIYEKCKPLLEIMDKDIREGPLICMDETPVQVLNEGDRKKRTNSYMWVSRGGSRDRLILKYNYFANRSVEFIKEYLKEYKGYIQCDGYSVYKMAGEKKEITLVGCWAHARRKFIEVTKAAKNKPGSYEGLRYIQELYKIERECKDKGAEEIKELRQELSKPVLEAFKKWLDKRVLQIPPKTLLGKAINYTLHEWKKLNTYLEDGRIPIDNNLVENAIRPFVIGRKNWLFSATAKGAQASAGIYSLIETAKANNLEPFWYLLYLFEKLPEARTEEDYNALLPYNVKKTALKSPVS